MPMPSYRRNAMELAYADTCHWSGGIVMIPCVFFLNLVPLPTSPLFQDIIALAVAIPILVGILAGPVAYRCAYNPRRISRLALRDDLYALPLALPMKQAFLARFDQTQGLPPRAAKAVFNEARRRV